LLIQKFRLQRGWSQQQLADLSGLSVRTIQRIEQGHVASTESLKSLAAVFEIDFATLQEDTQSHASLPKDEALAFKHVRKVKEFYLHLLRYALILTFLLVVNLLTQPAYLWVIWVAIGWGIGVLFHALSVFGKLTLFGAEWEKKQVEKRLGRKI
jgi:transcriptional regulator with XRE-family HTH domain